MPTTKRGIPDNITHLLWQVGSSYLLVPPHARAYFFPDAFVRRGKGAADLPADLVPTGRLGAQAAAQRARLGSIRRSNPPDDNPPPEVVPEPASLLFGLIGLRSVRLGPDLPTPPPGQWFCG
jgi:hypothetical protein